MRALILAAGAVLSLAACSKTDDSANNDMNVVATDNMMVDQNAALGGMDGNAATNSEAENMMMANDMTHNDADTNLANGM